MIFAVIPPTPVWSPSIAIVMIACNVAAVLLWKTIVPLINSWLGAIGYEARSVLTIPAGSEIYTFNFPGLTLTLPELLAAASFGHLIGAGVILGLTRLGAL
ncbi:MAG: photosystem I reaction center subunit PsaK [Cyanobacteriota bacterium]|nr:photosystem I reaction center subunit PsaK [Cyanobacteriota bacterium]